MKSRNDRNSVANDIADWIVDQVSARGSLDQATAIAYARARFGEPVLARNPAGAIVLDVGVVEALRIRGTGRIVWESWARRWRRREWYETVERRAA